MIQSSDDLLLLYDFRVNLDLDVVPNHRFTGLEKVVIDQVEIFSVDGCGRVNSIPRR